MPPSSGKRASKHPLVPDLTARWRSHDDGCRAWAVPGTPARGSHERARNGAPCAWQLPLSIVQQDQVAPYATLEQVAPNLTAVDLPRYYNDASFGVPADQIERWRCPVPAR